MENEKNAVLVDGSSFIYRAFYASPELTYEGRSVGAVYGFCSILISLMNNHRSDLFAVVLDSGRDTFRSEIYPEYKANRSATPEALRDQFPLIKEACLAFGLPIIKQQGFEADDLIASYSHQLSNNGYKVKIIGIDKDLVQLMSDNITIFDPIKSKTIQFTDVVEKYGVLPSQMVYFQALVGDSSDNIPGVEGIGPVTASKLIKEYQTLDGIYKNIEKISSNKIKEKLKNHKNNAELSLKLATLDRNIKICENFHEINIKYNHDNAVNFLSSLGFDLLIKRINKSSFFYQENKNTSLIFNQI